MIVWDRGTWDPLDDPHEGLRQGKLEFELHAEKLHGAWVLVATRQRRPSRQPQWLLIKAKDGEARSHDEIKVTEEFPGSVDSRRTIEETDTAPKSKAKKGKKAKLSRSTRAASRLTTIAGAKPAAMPQSIDLQLATLVSQPPSGDEWLNEIKLDGYRITCRIDRGEATLYSRRRQDWTERFASIAAAAGELPVEQAILDGEVVVFLNDGRTSFQTLQNALVDAGAARLSYVVFDLLYLDGYDLGEVGLEDRKRVLAELLLRQKDPRIQYLDHVVGQGDRFFAECCRRELEGIICRRRARRYVAGRGQDWLKAKCLLRQEFVIGGYTDSINEHRPFGALLVGYYDKPGRLSYAGRVGTGWSQSSMAALATRLKPLRQAESPFVAPVDRSAGKTHWVRPRLVADVSFSQWTRDGRLRQPSFQGLREDKPAAAVGREEPKERTLGEASTARPRLPKRRSAAKPASTAKANGGLRSKRKLRNNAANTDMLPERLQRQLEGVTLTNPDRVLYPEQGLTKLDLALYYAQVGESMLPYVVDRPLSLVRCPRGRAEKCFFQKHRTGNIPASLPGIAVREGGQLQTYFALKDLAGLMALAQLGVLEIHIWGSKGRDLERPDRVVFDLDPGPGVAWDRIVGAAVELRQLLAGLGLKSFVKTTGGKGLHVVSPIEPSASWAEAKTFAKTVAQQLVAAEPTMYTVRLAKSQRQGKVFLDYLRNDRGATSVAPYSTRARPGAPVSVPLTWRELSSDISADHFNVRNVPERLARQRSDPWMGFFELRQRLPHGSTGRRP